MGEATAESVQSHRTTGGRVIVKYCGWGSPSISRLPLSSLGCVNSKAFAVRIDLTTAPIAQDVVERNSHSVSTALPFPGCFHNDVVARSQFQRPENSSL